MTLPLRGPEERWAILRIRRRRAPVYDGRVSRPRGKAGTLSGKSVSEALTPFRATASGSKPDVAPRRFARGRLGLRAALSALVLSGLILLHPVPGRADIQTISDANDVKGKLDIKKVTVAHVGNSFRHTIVTYRGWKSALLVKGNALVMAFDTDGDPNKVERWVVVQRSAKKLKAFLTNEKFIILRDDLEVSHPNRRKTWVEVTRSMLSSPPGYTWAGLSVYYGKDICKKGCVDAAPNDSFVIHDYTPPDLSFYPPADPTSTYSANDTFSAQISASDAGFSGIQGWELQVRELGQTAWEVAASGTGNATGFPVVQGRQGATYDLRAIARDNAGNETESNVATVTVPWDDDHPDVSPGFSGDDWTLHTTISNDFMSTRHETTTPGASFSFDFTGTGIGWIASNQTGIAEVVVDDGQPTTVDLSTAFTWRHVVFSQSGLPPGDHRLTITVQSGRAVVDALWVMP